jgi:hypothetical protein
MPSTVDDARRWRELSEQSYAIAQQMTNSTNRKIMLVIAKGYELLAQHADGRGVGSLG